MHEGRNKEMNASTKNDYTKQCVNMKQGINGLKEEEGTNKWKCARMYECIKEMSLCIKGQGERWKWVVEVTGRGAAPQNGGEVNTARLSNTANGVVDGIATLVAIPGSEYTRKNYMSLGRGRHVPWRHEQSAFIVAVTDAVCSSL